MVVNVQRKFTKKIFHRNDLSYKTRLFALSEFSLEMRRARFDVCLLYKILYRLVNPIDGVDLALLNNSNRSNGRKICIRFSRSDLRKHFFTNPVVSLCKYHLPPRVVPSLTISQFKHSITSCQGVKA